MSKSFKVAALVAVTAMFLTAPVFAQVNGPESNTFKSTAGVFSGDVDDSQDVHSYSGVEFEKWFGFVGYGGSATTNPVQLGFATRFSGLYLGTWYSGNVVNVRENQIETVRVNYDLPTQLQTTTVTTTVYGTANTITSNNEIGVLIGVAGMGFRIGFFENVTETKYPNRTITVTENQDGRVVQTTGDIVEYSNVNGTLYPSLTWGMDINLGSVTLKPTVTLGAEFRLNNRVDNYRNVPFTTINGEFVGVETLNLAGNNSGYITPSADVGIGIEFENFGIDVGYGIEFGIYDNDYNASGFSGSTAGTVTWNGSKQTTTTLTDTRTVTNTNLTITDQSSLNHSISLGFYTDKEVVEGLKLGLYAGVVVGIDTSTTDSYNRNLTTTETVNNNTALSSSDTTREQETRGNSTVTDTTTLRISPEVNIGAIYNWFPGRFSINAGIRLRPLAYTNTVTKVSNPNNGFAKDIYKNGNGDVTSESITASGRTYTEDQVTVDNTWSYLTAGLFTGFTFNFNETMALDLGASGWLNSSGVGTTTFNSTISTLNVLLSFKF